MSSEKAFGVPDQPSDTCPMIDDALKDAGAAESSIGEIKERLEGIRSHVITIREWGQGWKDKAKEFYEELEETKKELELAKNDRDYYEREYNNYQERYEALTKM